MRQHGYSRVTWLLQLLIIISSICQCISLHTFKFFPSLQLFHSEISQTSLVCVVAARGGKGSGHKPGFSLCKTLNVMKACSETRDQVNELEGKAFPEKLPQSRFSLQPSASTGVCSSCLVPEHLLPLMDLHYEDLRMFPSPRERL